jgi:ABC-type transporter Mla subunit MlaD
VESGGDLTAELDTQRAALKQLVSGTGEVFAALTEREDQLSRLITSQDDVFTAIAGEREAFAETWRIFPTFLDESKATFRRLDEFSGKAEPVVRDLAPAMRDLRVTLREVGEFGPDLRRFFVALDPLLTLSKRSLPATSQVLRGLRPLLGELHPFLGQVNPILEYIGVHAYTLSDMFANLGVATAAKVKDPTAGTTGHYLRQFGPQGTETVAMYPNRLATNRGNAYPNPMGIINSPEAQRFKILPNFDCVNAGGEKEPEGTTPGCREQRSFEFRGDPTTRYPRLTEKAYPAP